MSDDASTDTELAFNPFDPSQTQHMWGLMERLRAECPVSRPMDGFVYTASYADTASTFKDAKRFSSRGGLPRRGRGRSRRGELPRRDRPAAAPACSPALAPRVHTRTAREVEPFTRELTEPAARADRRQRRRRPHGRAVHACSRSRCRPKRSGSRDEQHAEVAHWCQELLHSTWPETNETERGVGIGGGFPEFAGHHRRADPAAARVGADPPDDLLTRMVQAEDDGDRLTDLHIRTLAVNTLAGSLSTTYMLGQPALPLRCRSRRSRRRCRADRALIPEAVEESLRLEPPVLFLFRTVKEDTTIGDTPVHAGERVIIGIASANRDEQAYECPDEFRLDRGITTGDAPDHLTFGVGPHICLGIHVARMEGRVVLETMLDRFAPGAGHAGRRLRAAASSRCSSSTAPRRWT